jgi:hypothetical protein
MTVGVKAAKIENTANTTKEEKQTHKELDKNGIYNRK